MHGLLGAGQVQVIGATGGFSIVIRNIQNKLGDHALKSDLDTRL